MSVYKGGCCGAKIVVDGWMSSPLLTHLSMVHNLPRSSAMSPIPLFRKVTSESVSKGRSALHKKLVQLFNQKTLVSSLISKKDRVRMTKGKALLHVVGGKPTQCVAMATPGQHAGGRGGVNQYKGGQAQSGGHSISPSQHLHTSSTSPNMSSAGKENIITGQGPALPTMGKGMVASTPTSARRQVTRICGVSFEGEIKEARSIISANDVIEEIFLNLLEDCEDAERVLDVHESLETGDLEDADAALWMPFVAQYVKLLRSALGRVSTTMTKEQQGAKIRLLVRPEGKFMKGLAQAEAQAQCCRQSPPSSAGQSNGGGGEASAMPSSTAGEKRGISAPSSQCPKLLRRSVSNASLASETASYSEISEENIHDEPTLSTTGMDSDIVLNPKPHPICDVQKDEAQVFENARKSMMEYERRISQSAVRSEDLDSDGDEEKIDHKGVRFADYPEGVGRAMAIGPIIPKTQEFIVVGPVPMGDSTAAALNKKMSNLAKAVTDGDKGSKALTAFSPLEIQKNFAPGEPLVDLKTN